MMKRTTTVNTVMLLRFDDWDRIKDQYERRYLTFSCAANWFNHAITNKNNTIGDVFEGVFARISSDESSLAILHKELKEKGSNLITTQLNDGTILLRYKPIILQPSLCFYNYYPYNKESSAITDVEESLNISEILSALGYPSGLLHVLRPEQLLEELKKQVPLAVEENITLLSDREFLNRFDPHEPIEMQDINYTAYPENSLFYNCSYGQELFWKLSKYKDQKETRVVINNISFAQPINNDFEGYDAQKSLLKVKMPNIQQYAKIYQIDEIKGIEVALHTC